jgi:hypothetical protein
MSRMPLAFSRIAFLFCALLGVATAPAQGRLDNPQPAADDHFGESLAASERWLLVGVPADANVGGMRTGSVVVFESIGGQYVEHSRLFAADGAAGDAFGIAVSVDGDTAVVGAWNDSLPAGSGAGSVYVFDFDGVAWNAGPKLVAPDGATGDGFGASVSLEGDVLLVGAPFDDLPSLANAGSAHLFVRNGGWAHAVRVVAPDATPFDFFGTSVAAAGDNLLVGAADADAGAGAVYAFDRDGAQADFLHRLVSSDRGAQDRFGAALSIDADAVLVGAALHAEQNGAAYLFERVGSTWSQRHKFVAPAATPQERVGTSVALLGDVALLGTPNATSGDCCHQGAVDVFVRIAQHWRFDRRLRAADSAPFDELGRAIALNLDGAFAGAPLAQPAAATPLDAGSVVHFSAEWSFFKDGFESVP